MLEAAERLARMHNVRAFEALLAAVASQVRAPGLRWASATVASPHTPERTEPTVVVLVGLTWKALLALGVLHLVAWWRVGRAVEGRAAEQGYRVRVWVTAR